MSARWEPTAVTTEFVLHERFMPDTEPEVLAEVKGRMVQRLAYLLAEHLTTTPGGAFYSPLTYTIREDEMWAGSYRVIGTVQVLDCPDPETGEYRLVGGPLHGGTVKIGHILPDRMQVPVPLSVYRPDNEPTFATYEPIKDVQALRFVP